METAGEAGNLRLGKADAETAGAERGYSVLRGVGGSFVLMGAGTCLGLFGFFSSWGFSLSSHSQLTSDRAVDGALSICSPFSFSDSSEFAELLLELLSVLLAVLVRLITALPV